tara:strand:+ start:29432 stop:31609 length:2178 start_codon:yes stop_codon:yes gene_type:complete
MSNSNGVTYLRDNQHFKQSLNTEALARIQKISQLSSQHLIEMLQNMFDGVDDSFFELANNARTNNEQNLFFEAMREVRIKRKSIENDFKIKICNLFSSTHVFSKKSNTLTTHEVDFDKLSLVNKDDLEEDVAISSMASKATSNFPGPLLQFQTRAANLFGQTDLSAITPPLNPEDISKAFALCCSKLEINLKERLIVYKQFDRYVLSNLGYVLDEANQYLIKSGILPNLKSSITKQQHKPKHSINTPQQTQNVLPQLQTLLANIRSKSPEEFNPNQSTPNTTSQHYIGTQDLINLLSNIQNSAPLQTSSPKVIDIQSQLKQHLQQSSPLKDKNPAFNQVDEDLINLVAMLFEFILDDYNLAAPIQVLISRLQIPILKIVIRDNSFFSTNRHPARKLLNTLAKAGIGWNENQNREQDALYQKIYGIIHSILDAPESDIALFDSLNKELEEFMTKEEKKFKIVEQRTKESEKGLLKSKQAQKTVDKFISTFTNNKDIHLPEIIHETLIQGWSRVMFLAYLKDDQEHQWDKSCQAVQDLIWCLQPIKSQKDRQHWIVIAPKLIKELKRGLKDVSYHTNNLDETIIQIRTILTSTFKQNSFDDIDNKATFQTNQVTVQPESLSAVEKQLIFNDSTLEKYSNLIDEIALGTWFEFHLAPDKKTRCKLSTSLKEADSFIFVNRLGLKSLEKTREELATDLHKKNVIILEQGPLIDRAMNAVTSSLKQKASA